ncbi:NCOA7 [Bugula neritina]|uniref:Oxidation resistance protein 1 n=1 Tax=Bugula neritina TaxID=10212 RepID=A0A7J7KQ98_BUGNE|nr:NCOA7 [Bugula neritina]
MVDMTKCINDIAWLVDLVAEANQKEQTNSEPYYLCLQVAQPINSPCGADTCPIEAYGKKKKPEYWFSISGEKVEDLYKFFIQWRPELYGEEITDEGVLNSKGFIAIPPEGLDSENVAKCSRSPLVRTLSNVQVLKGWEILSVNEILRQQSIDYESYISVPDMVGESLLLSDENIKKLVMCLPARVEGHRWRLAYSNEAHGFSLNTLYRNMCEFESATLVVILDDNDRMFGAFSSAPLHLCEHFYGTGECFLFTFVNGFKSYPWSGKNMFCVRGGQQALTFGTGSSACGLWLDADIYHGRTQHCDTFNNDPLTGDDEDFIVKAIEVWGLNDQEFDCATKRFFTNKSINQNPAIYSYIE